MASVEFAERVSDDFDRITLHLVSHGVAEPEARIGEIVDACSLLERHPLLGRSVGPPMRELVIGQGSHGYVVLYRYAAHADRVDVLAVRSQREAGYRLD